MNRTVLFVLLFAGLTGLAWAESAADKNDAPQAGKTASDKKSDKAAAKTASKNTPKKPAWLARAPAGAEITPEGWFAPKPKLDKPALPEKIERAFVIPIREQIRKKTYQAIKRKALRCLGKGAQLIIIDMDTPGGEVLSALKICELIKSDLNDIYVVCYVRKWAISAGAMIALACDEIIMTPVGKIGDCAPIAMGSKLTGVEREKIETVIREEFESSAGRNGYSVALATSMVSHDQEVWLVRSRDTHELRYVLASKFRPKVSNPPGSEAKSSGLFSFAGRKAKPWEFLHIVLAKGKLLTMASQKAVKLGFVSDLVKAPPSDPYAELIERFNIVAKPTVLGDNWSEDLVDFLTHPAIAGVIFFAMLLFGYTEMHTPGFGVFGSIALACLVTLLCSQFLVGLANWWEIVVFALGVGLILLEIFVIPGFGVAGISGIVLCVLGLGAMLIPNSPDKFPWPTTNIGWSQFENGAFALCVAFIASAGAMIILAKYLPKVSLLTRSKLILAPAVAAVASPRTGDSPLLHLAPGQRGLALSTLRPAGQGRFDDELIDVIAEGTFIEAGQAVEIVKIEGNRAVVAQVREGV